MASQEEDAVRKTGARLSSLNPLTRPSILLGLFESLLAIIISDSQTFTSPLCAMVKDATPPLKTGVICKQMFVNTVI